MALESESHPDLLIQGPVRTGAELCTPEHGRTDEPEGGCDTMLSKGLSNFLTWVSTRATQAGVSSPGLPRSTLSLSLVSHLCKFQASRDGSLPCHLDRCSFGGSPPRSPRSRPPHAPTEHPHGRTHQIPQPTMLRRWPRPQRGPVSSHGGCRKEAGP